MPQPTFHASYLLPVAIGSALGGMARYAMTDVVQNRADSTFPFGTLAVNVVGCLIIGLLVQLASGRFSPAVQALLTTGFCGGFTTFSTFSYESMRLVQEGLWQRAVTYVVVSVAVGLGAYWVGATLVRGTSAP
jgi:fluoride exporter